MTEIGLGISNETVGVPVKSVTVVPVKLIDAIDVGWRTGAKTAPLPFVVLAVMIGSAVKLPNVFTTTLVIGPAARRATAVGREVQVIPPTGVIVTAGFAV